MRQAVGHVIDLAPTMLQLAGGSWPTECRGQPLPPTPGCSLVSTFDVDSALPRKALWWLHEGNRALRVGDWKLVAAKGDPWELYNLHDDRAENDDRAADFPDRVKSMRTLWQTMTREFQNSRSR